ncbi:unnamed protein product [Aphanomyces euteiches]
MLLKDFHDEWSTKMTSKSPDLMDKLFNVDNSKHCVEFEIYIVSRIVKAMNPGDTETSFISFWDDLIRNVLNFMLSDVGKSERNSSRSASTEPKRPDYLFIVDSVCVFRGEGKVPGDSIETPRRELVDKLVWSYGDVPYLFGYTAVGYDVRLYALTHVDNVTKAIELAVYNLAHLEGRFRLLLAILNIVRLLRCLAKMCPDSARGEYRVLKRDFGVKLLLDPLYVVKSFPKEAFEVARSHVEAVYTVLREQKVPNVDSLVRVDKKHSEFIFRPRGQARKPANLEELFHALTNVLQALVKLHTVSWMHRDIRWSNVIMNHNDNSWFLIDFMDAAPCPQSSPSGNHLSKAEHAPEIFIDGGSHKTAVDIWSVGFLIGTCEDNVCQSWYDLGGKRSQFHRELMDADPSKRPTAAAALDRLGHFYQEYVGQQVLPKETQDPRKKKQRPN